ncbi:MAG: 7TM-DISM domain-containing protein [Oligoflexales bacterium]
MKFLYINENQKVYVEYAYPAVDYVSLYYLFKGNYQSFHLGEYIERDDDSLFYRSPIFILEIPPGINTYYLRIKTEGSNQFPIKI